MNIRYPIYEGVYRILTVEGGTGILGGNQHSETTITLNNLSKK